MATSHWAVGFTLEGKKKLLFFSRFRLSLFDIVEVFLLPWSLSTNSLILCKSPTEMKIDRFLRRRMVYLFVVGAVEWSISSSSVPWRSPTEMMFGDDLDSSKFSSSSVHAITVKVRLTFFCCSRDLNSLD